MVSFLGSVPAKMATEQHIPPALRHDRRHTKVEQLSRAETQLAELSDDLSVMKYDENISQSYDVPHSHIICIFIFFPCKLFSFQQDICLALKEKNNKYINQSP